MQREFTTEALVEAAVEAVWNNEIKSKYQNGDIPHSLLKEFTNTLTEVSRGYVSKTYSNIGENQAKAYALYFMPINFAKISFLLKGIAEDFWEKDLSVLDFGCGTGTGIFAVSGFLRGDASVLGVDSSQAMLKIAKSVADKIPALSDIKLSFSTSVPNQKKFNLIIASNVLNESNNSQSLVERIVESLTDDGIIIILEPALTDATRNLMQLRDTILAKYNFNILFPCTHRLACPMLSSSKKDWCHGSISWQAPRLVSQIDEITGFNKHRIKYSALVLSKTFSTPKGVRVVGIPKKTKLGVQALVCGENIYRLENIGKAKHFERLPFPI